MDAFLERVTVPHLLLLPRPDAVVDLGDGGINTTLDLRETADAGPASPTAFSSAIPLSKGANPFGHMVTVGRANNNDVVIKNKRVSKFHAYFRQLGESWSLFDANSSNGTFLNGIKLAPERARPLKKGDRIGFGKEITTVFLLPAALFELLRQS